MVDRYSCQVRFGENARARTMTVKELIKRISNETGFMPDDIREVINSISGIISYRVKKGDRVYIPGLGIFFLSYSIMSSNTLTSLAQSNPKTTAGKRRQQKGGTRYRISFRPSRHLRRMKPEQLED